MLASRGGVNIESTKSDVERILGPDHSTDQNRWSDNFSDRVYDVAERSYRPALGILPFTAGVVPTNTRPWFVQPILWRSSVRSAAIRPFHVHMYSKIV